MSVLWIWTGRAARRETSSDLSTDCQGGTINQRNDWAQDPPTVWVTQSRTKTATTPTERLSQSASPAKIRRINPVFPIIKLNTR